MTVLPEEVEVVEVVEAVEVVETDFLVIHRTTTITPLTLEGTFTPEEVEATQEEEGEEVPLFLETRWDHPPPMGIYQRPSKPN